LPAALGALRIAPGSDGYTWRFDQGKNDLAPMLAPILRSAAELLTSPALGRVRECDSDTCWWLFLDSSKSGTRRWCDMKVCGNREKARRHHKRHKSSGT
jgi:predicted RNA-binding Zn ribbon-like protein